VDDSEHGDPFTHVLGSRRGRTPDTPLTRLRAVIAQVSAVSNTDAGELASLERWAPPELAGRLSDRASSRWPGAWRDGWQRAMGNVQADADCSQLRRAVQDAMVAALLGDELKPDERALLLAPWRALGRE
jgi:hypothetical protein